MNRKERFSPPAIGGVSLLVVFAVLCLTIFALLGLATVQADSRLADTSAKAVADYYAADCEAQAILARLRTGEIPDGVVEGDGIYSYTCPVSETQKIEVEVSLDGKDYRILRWQLVPAWAEGEEEGVDSWEELEDDGLNLWDGSSPF